MDKKIVALFRLVAVAIVFVLSAQSAEAQITTTGSGSWSSTTPDAPWPLGIIPPTSENIIVGTGFTLTVDVPSTCNSISAGAGSTIINNSDFTITTNLTGVGSLIQGTNAILSIGGTSTIATFTATANPNTVIFAGAGPQTIRATTYNHLTTSGGGTKTAAITTINGDLSIGVGTTLAANNTLLVSGTTTLDGTITFTNTSTKTFVGTVTINPGGNWNNATEAITLQGGITNNGAFTAGTGLYTFNTNSQFLSGTAFTMTSMTVTGTNISLTNNMTGTLTVSGTLTVNGGETLINNGTITVGTALSGAGTFTQGSGSTLNISGTSGITNMTATASGNTVNYTGATQTVHSNAYENLGLSGSGVKTLQVGTTSITGNFDLGGTATTTVVAGLTITGNVTLASTNPAGFTAGSFTHNVGGNWTNNGTTFDGTGSTIVLNGAGQTIGGSSSTSFNTLTFSGSGTKTFAVSTAVSGTLSVGSGVVADLSTFTTHTANMLMLNGALQIAGTWGGTGSGATNINTTFFAANTGRITAAVGDYTYYARNNGNWNSPSTWSTVGHGSSTNAGTFPTASNFAVIGGNFTVTVTANAACANLSFDAGNAVTNTLTINSGNTLAVTGAVTIPQTITSGSNILNVGAGNLTAGSLAFTSGSPGGTGHRMTISTGTATISGNVSGTGTSSTVQFTGAGFLRLGGSFYSAANGTLTTVAGSTVEYNGGAQTVEAQVYNNLTLSGTGSKTQQNSFTMTGNLAVNNNATFVVGGFQLVVTGTTTVASGGTLSITGTANTKAFTGPVTIALGGIWNNTANEAVTFRGGIINNGNFTAGTATQTFDTNSQALSGTAFTMTSMTVTGTNISLTNNMTGTLTVSGTLTVNGGETLINNGTITVGTALSGAGTFTQGSTGNPVLNIGGTSGITNLVASGTGNTVNYTGASDQTIRSINYVNLGLSGGGGFTKTALAGLTVAGNLTIATGTQFDAGSFTHNVAGNWDNNGTLVAGTHTINLNGTAQNITGGITTFNDLRLSGTGTKTFSVGVTIGNELAIDNGAIANLSNANVHTSITLVLAGAAQTSGTWGNTASAATNQNNTFFSGDGVISVSVAGNTYYSIADADWSAATTWSTTGFGGGAASQAPGIGDYVIIGNGRSVTVAGTQQCQELLFDATISATNSLSISGNLAVAGPITIPQNTANTLSVGAGTLTAASLDFTAGTGTHQLTINTGTATISGNITGIGVSSTVEFIGAGILRVGGSIFTSATGTLTAPSGTVEYNGSSQTVQALPYRNLTLSGSGNKTLATTTTISGSLVVGDNTTFVVGAVTLAVTGTTTIGGGNSGILSITSTTGTKTFTGTVIVDTNGTWTNTTEAVTFQGGITNAGTFTAGTGVHTFNTNSQTLTGSFAIPNVTVTGGAVVLTNTDDLTVSTALSGTGRITQFDNGSVLNIGGTSGITNMTATVAGNTVNYTGGAQTVKNVNYANLGLSGGVKTLQSGTTTISGNLTLSNGASATAVIDLTIGGAVNIASDIGTTLNDGGFHLNVGGNWNNSGTFTSTVGGEVLLNGGPGQQITGSSPQTFYDLVLAGTGAKVFTVEVNIQDALSINSGALADLGTIVDHTANRLILNGALQSNTGLWGSSASSAPVANQNDTYFLNPSTGVIDIAVGGFNLYSVADGNWSSTSTWSTVGFGGPAGAGPPTVNDNVFIGRVGGGTRSVIVDVAAVCASLEFDAGVASVNNTVTINPGNSLTVSGSIIIPQAATTAFSNTLAVGTGSLTAQDLSFTSTPGGAGHSMTISTGTATINGDVSGIGVPSTIQFTGTGLLRVSGTMFPSGSGTLTAFAGSTVEYNGAAQTVQGLPYNNLTLSGSGSKALAANATVSGNLAIGNGVTFTIGAFTFAVTGTTTVGGGSTGTLFINSATGTKTFTGQVTIAGGGTWSNTANELVTFRGGITNNGTFTAGTGAQTFDTNSQALTGTLSMPSVTVTGVTLTNNGTLTVNTALSGSGEIAQGSGGSAILNIGFAGPPAITTMTATGTGNTVNYTGAAQTIRATSYVNLGLSGSGVKTLTGVNTVTGNLTLSGTVSATAAANLTIGGAVTIGSGTTFTSGAFDHAIGGNWTNNGTFNNSSHRISFTGGAATKIIQGTTPTTFYDITIGEGAANPDVQVEQTVNLVGEMTFANNAIFDADGSGGNQVFTLISTASGDARIGALGGTADVTGNVTVQRYMDAEGKIYRYISTPVANPTAQDLQGEIPITGPFTGSSFPPQTGCTSCAPCTGCVLDNTSMYVYDESIVNISINNRYAPFPSVGGSNAETMIPGRGYAVYLRNDQTPTTWNLRAPINTGEVDLNPSFTPGNDGWNLVGNPYPSPIDWNAGWTRSNIDPTYYIWDNSINNYASFTLNGSGTNGGTRYIAHGQAFWVLASNASADLRAQEVVKADRASVTQATFFRTATAMDQVRVKLIAANSSDELLIKVNQEGASLGYDARIDAYEFPADTLLSLHAVTSDKKKLAVNVLGVQTTSGSEIKVGLAGTKPGSYKLDFVEYENFTIPTSVFLYDAYDDVLKEVLPADKEYQFTVTDDPVSAGADRFVLFIGPAGKQPMLEKFEATMVSVYPNPTVDKVNVRIKSSEPASASIYGLTGVQVIEPTELSQSGNQRIGQFDLTLLPAGVYIIQIQSGANLLNKRIMKQ